MSIRIIPIPEQYGARPLFDVEAKSPCVESMSAALGEFAEENADLVEELRIGRWI